MSKKDILYLITITTDETGLKILNKMLDKLNKRIKYNAMKIAEKRKENKMYARSKKEKLAHKQTLAKRGGAR